MLSVGDRVTCTYRGSHVGEVTRAVALAQESDLLEVS